MKHKKTKIFDLLPDGWHEVSFDSAIKIIEGDKNPISIVEKLINGRLPKNKIEVSKQQLNKSTDLKSWLAIVSSLTFLEDLPLKENRTFFPKKVLGKELPWVSFSNKFDLGGCTVDQVESMKRFLAERKDINEQDFIKEVYPAICAIYLQPILDNDEFYYQKAIEKTLPFIKQNIDFKTIISMGDFFLKKLNALINTSKKESNKAALLVKKLKLDVTRFLRRLGFTLL